MLSAVQQIVIFTFFNFQAGKFWMIPEKILQQAKILQEYANF